MLKFYYRNIILVLYLMLLPIWRMFRMLIYRNLLIKMRVHSAKARRPKETLMKNDALRPVDNEIGKVYNFTHIQYKGMLIK